LFFPKCSIRFSIDAFDIPCLASIFKDVNNGKISPFSWKLYHYNYFRTFFI
jgi:hypothetical protein